MQIVYAVRRDGLPLDSSYYSAYQGGRAAAVRQRPGGAARLLAAGYEQLLAIELAPERAAGPKLGGKIERIRIQF